MVVRLRASLAALVLVACGPAAPVDAPVAPPGAIGTDLAPKRAPGSGWYYHPPEMAEVVSGWPLADGRWLLAGDLGERWLTEPLPRAPSAASSARPYRARPSVYRAPERLVGVLPWQEGHPGEGSWLFVGETGTLYAADEPLGPLTARAAAPHPLRRVAGVPGAAIGLDLLGVSYRYQGDGWHEQPASTPKLYEVASSAGGELLGLGMPETLWRSGDRGASWSRLSPAPFGARTLVRAEGGGVIVRGVAGDMHWSGGDGLREVKGQVPLTLPTAGPLELLPPRGPRGSAIEQRMAIVDGDRYYEVFEQEPRDPVEGAEEDRRSRWMLARGYLGADLELRSLDLRATCPSGVVLAARDAHLVLACAREQGESTVVDLFRSTNGGDRFRRVTSARLAPQAEVAMAVAPEGTALLSGLCTPATKGDERCAPGSPLRLAASATKLAQTRADELSEGGESPIFSDDGERAYFVGRRAKDGAPAVFVSSDGGQTFHSQVLSAPKESPGEWRAANQDLDMTLAPGADGELGILLAGEPPRYLAADEDGRVEIVAILPAETVAVSGHGRAIFALGARRGQDGKLIATGFESLDAGAAFRPVAPPLALDMEELERATVHCGSGGCVLGDRLTRVGWGGADAPAALAIADRGRGAPQPAVRTAIRCSVDEASGWAELDRVAERRDAPLAPSALQAYRGRSQWSVLRFEDGTGLVEAVSAEEKAGKIHLERRVLFAKVKNRSRIAYEVSPQMEGYAAVRVRLPTAREELAGQPLLDVEVAWINYLRGEHGQARVADAGHFDVDHVTPGPRPRLMTPLVSVSPGGLLLRPSDNQHEVFVLGTDGQELARADYPGWPPIHMSPVRNEAVLVGGSLVAVGLFADTPRGGTSTLSLAALVPNPSGRSATPAFVSLAPSDLEGHVDLRWSYRGAEVGSVVLILDAADNRGRGYFAPFTADGQLGAAVPVPTQLDLPSAPPACADAERQTTARVVAPFMSGTRHPVLVSAGAMVFTLLTSRAVLHGTPSHPCVLGWDAQEVGRGSQGVSALIAGDMRSGWLFRETDGGGLQHRPLSCQPSPDEPLPDTLWREPGTVVLP